MENEKDKVKVPRDLSFLWKVYVVVLLTVFIFACCNRQAEASSLDDAIVYMIEHPETPVSEFMQDETHYNYLKDYASERMGVTLPAWDGEDNTDVYNFFRNIASGFIGQYALPDSATLSSIVGTYNDLQDFMNFFSFNAGSGEFVINSSGQEGLLSEINHYIYVSGSDMHDKWYSLNDSISFYYTYYGGGITYSPPTGATEDFWICWVSNGTRDGTVLISSKQSGNWRASSNWGASYVPNSGPTTYTVNGHTYYYAYRSLSYAGNYGDGTKLKYPSSSSSPAIGYYSSVSAALAALWGEGEPSTEPYLNGAIIVNDNPTFTPMSLPSSILYDYSTKIVDKYEEDDPTPIPHDIYQYVPQSLTYDIPYWLQHPSIEFPEEPDYLENLDVELPEIETDSTFIQTVYETLPSGIVLMITVSLGLGIVIRIIS